MQKEEFALLKIPACCTCISNSAKVEIRVHEILNHATWLKGLRETQLLPSMVTSLTWNWKNWLWSLLGLLMIPLLSILGMLLFGPCLFNLFVKFVSSRLQQFHLQMMVHQGFQPPLPPPQRQLNPLIKLANDSEKLTLCPDR